MWGLGAGTGERSGGDRNTLDVVKIAYRCSASTGSTSLLERALAESGHADVYDIYFSFNSDELREESEFLRPFRRLETSCDGIPNGS